MLPADLIAALRPDGIPSPAAVLAPGIRDAAADVASDLEVDLFLIAAGSPSPVIRALAAELQAAAAQLLAAADRFAAAAEIEA